MRPLDPAPCAPEVSGVGTRGSEPAREGGAGRYCCLTTVGTPGTRRRSLWRGGIAAPETAQCRLYQRTQ
jgi:hypothetical protein